MKEKFREYFFGSLLWVLFRVLSLTWRKTSDPVPQEIEAAIREGRPYIMAHFHEDEWPMISFYRKIHPNVMVSHSQDGNIMARFLSMNGFHVSRGSSSRGAVGGFLGLLKLVKRSEDPQKMVTLAVDGPRGPRRRAKYGVFKLSELLNADILSAAIYADRAWVAGRSWSRAFVPKPFARVHRSFQVAFKPGEIEKAVERDDLADMGYRLEKSLVDAKSMAQNALKSGTAPG